VAQYGRSIFSSLSGVFAEVIATPGEQAWLFASRSKGVVLLDPSGLTRRFRDLQRRDMTISPEIFPSLIPIERVASTQERFRGSGNRFGRPIQNTDDKPITFLLSLLVSIKRAGLSVGKLLDAVRALGLVVFILPIVVFVAWRLFYRGFSQTRERALAFNGVALMTLYGAVSISLCILLLLAFQNRFGHLFISIGLLSALFMLGLFLGGLSNGWVLHRINNRFGLWPVYAVLALSSALCLGLPLIVQWLSAAPYWVALSSYHLICLVSGILSGSAFPVAGFYLRDATKEVGVVAGVLESMDHWGAAFGAALVGVLVIPILGFSLTCLFLFWCLLASGFLFVIEQPAVRRIFEAAELRAWYRRWRVRIAPQKQGTGRRALVYITTGTIVCLGLISNMIVARLSAPLVDLDLDWIKTRFLAAQVERREKPFVHYLTRGSRARQSDESDRAERAFRELVFASRAVAPDIEGYGGPLNLLVAVGNEERILAVSLIESNETPAYIYGINQWFKQFEGWPLNRPIQLDENVDALTGATITARAAARIIDTCRVRAARDLFDRHVKPAADSAVSHRISAEAIVLTAAFIVSIVLFLKGNQFLRTLLLWCNMILFGLIYNFQFSTVHVTRLAAFDLPSLDTGELFVLTAGVLLLASGFGQIYCGYLCPFGAAQEILGRLGFVRKPNREGGRIRTVKYWILAIVLLVFFVTRSDSVTAFDPLQTAFSSSHNGWTVTLLFTIGFFSLLYFRFFCRHLCPAGAFLALFNRLALLLGFARPKAYSDCDLGVHGRWDVDCIQCNRCVEARSARIALSSTPEETDVAQIDAEKRVEVKQATPWLRDRWNRLLLLGVLLTISIALGSMHSRPAVDQSESFGRAREVNVIQIRKQIQEERLSDHEALFYTKPSQSQK
jgi:NosR/NirI family nitrous oxide reductase transcriptional regulator